MYEFRKVSIQNGTHQRTVLAMDFQNPEMAIVSEFLMSDANLLHTQILADIAAVQAGVSSMVEISGNRCALQIKKDTILITDLFEDMFDDADTLAPYEIGTEELKRLIKIYLAEKAKIES